VGAVVEVCGVAAVVDLCGVMSVVELCGVRAVVELCKQDLPSTPVRKPAYKMHTKSIFILTILIKIVVLSYKSLKVLT
jgi:uncharacterized membrane protein